MSLINDALKRAKEAQRQAPAPPPSQMQFRPVEPGQQVRHGLGLIVPVTLAFLALLALVLVWQWAQSAQAAEPREARAVPATAGTPQQSLRNPLLPASQRPTGSEPSPPRKP